MLGVKTFISTFSEPFDKNKKSIKKAKEKLKEMGERATALAVKREQALILKEWEEKQEKGKRIHSFLQKKELKTNKKCILGTYQRFEGEADPLYDPIEVNKLENGMTYLEKEVVSLHNGLKGYADKVWVENNFINIEDFKTYEHLYRTSSYITKTGFRVPATYFFSPISNLQCCNFNEGILQLSIYLYILWTHNKKLKPGKLFIRHVKTNEAEKIVSEELIEVPHLLEEVKAMFKHKKNEG